jgi:hypothetical protein
MTSSAGWGAVGGRRGGGPAVYFLHLPYPARADDYEEMAEGVAALIEKLIHLEQDV